MRRFIIKFISLFIIIIGTFLYYYCHILPNLSGDLGKLGQIPYGHVYDGLCINYYTRTIKHNPHVDEIYNPEILKDYKIITIGDSFSHMGKCGYQVKLSDLLEVPIGNFNTSQQYAPFQYFVDLINTGYLHNGQMIIIESVERSLIGRLINIDFNHSYQEQPYNEINAEAKEPITIKFISWLRLLFNYDNPVTSFHLNKDCFSHPRYYNTLHVLDSPYDSDLQWPLNNIDYEKAIINLEKLYSIAKSKGICVYILVATDKYDAYESFIIDKHTENPTLAYLPNKPYIINTKPYLQAAILDGTKDVYKLNNTHWSVIGADIVANELFKRIHNI